MLDIIIILFLIFNLLATIFVIDIFYGMKEFILFLLEGDENE